MKIITKVKKPRNPVAVPASQRQAGKHGGYRPERRERRIEKQKLQLFLNGKGKEQDHA